MTTSDPRVDQARQGKNPAVVARLRSGWVLLGDSQFLLGYCVLFADPVVSSLNAVDGAVRAQFLNDMAILGDAVMRATQAVRINYSILGNLDPVLHAHVFPRYAWEAEEQRTRPVWLYPPGVREAVPFGLPEHRDIMQRIHAELGRMHALDDSGVVYPWN